MMMLECTEMVLAQSVRFNTTTEIENALMGLGLNGNVINLEYDAKPHAPMVIFTPVQHLATNNK